MTLVLDAGGLVAIERGNRETIALVKRELHAGHTPVTHGAVIGQVWRGGSGRQARLAMFLPALRTVPVDALLGQRAGVLLSKTRTRDVVAAALVLLAADGDSILTSDPVDIAVLAAAAEIDVEVISV
ncbi:MAG: twitching motility protein PilT [Polyangiaceae bacterium]